MDSSQPKVNSQSIPSLTGLRAIAALMVFLHHYNPFAVWWPGSFLHHFFSHFHIGVALFFVLSGFLITYRYYPFQNQPLKSFFLNRFARIYPLFFVLTIISWFFQPEAFGFSKLSLVLNLLLLKGFFKEFLLSGIPQAWSLSVEETFYILAPFLFFLVQKDKRFLVFLPLFFISIGLIIVVIMKNFHNPFGFFGYGWFMAVFTFSGRAFEFFCGVSLAVFLSRMRKLSAKTPAFTLFGIFAIISGLVGLIWTDPNQTGHLNNIQAIVLNNALIPFFGFSFLIVGLIKEKSWLSIILQWPIFQWLGKTSYAFYLIHLGVVAKLISEIFSGQPFMQFLTLQLLASFLFFAIEEPARNVIRKMGKN